MNSKQIFQQLRLILLVCSLCGCAPRPGVVQAQREKRPNIIVILADDLGYRLVAQKAGFKPVAHDNRLRFTQFYVNSPICSPSRAAFLTGQYPARNSMHSYLNDRAANKRRDMPDWLNPNAPSIARAFKLALVLQTRR